MKRDAFHQGNDRRVADDHYGDRSLMCAAAGCPNRWSVSMGSAPCCSAHAWADPSTWPRITHEQLYEQTARAQRRAEAGKAEPDRKPDVPRLRSELAALGETIRLRQRDPKAWARTLRDREQGGSNLSDVQRRAWREALLSESSGVKP
jgi:hypothetical protein